MKTEDINNQLKESLITQFNCTDKEKTVESAIDFTISQLDEIPASVRKFLIKLKDKHPEIFREYSEEVILKVVCHLRLVGEQKREAHKLGTNIICFPNQNTVNRAGKETLVNEVKEFKLNEILNNKEVERSYRFLNPKTSFYACDKEKFYFVRDFDDNSKDVFENMLDITKSNALGFSIEGGTSCIRIFYNGKHIVDYLVSEQSGEWICHDYNDLFKLLKDLPIGDNHALLIKRVFNLAYLRKGAMLILTNNPNKDCLKTSNSVDLTGIGFQLVTDIKFYDYADYDGATVIEMKNDNASMIRCGVFLSPKNEISKDYEELIRKTSSGTRHEKAASYACSNRDDYLIVISENRSISVLHGIKPCYWKDVLLD